MRVAQHRKAKEADGYRLVQFWVPDYTNETYRNEIRREWESISVADEADGVMEWIEAINADILSDEPDFDWAAIGLDSDEIAGVRHSDSKPES